MALTEDYTTIKPYAEDKLAELADSKLPISISLTIIESLHKRWLYLLENVTEDQLTRVFIHPDSGSVTVEENTDIYSWQGNHHLVQIKKAVDYHLYI